MNNIECEVRSIITKEQYFNLLNRLKSEAQFLDEDDQINYHFEAGKDLRIQKNKYGAKIALKSGAMHDEQRHELEIEVSLDQFEKLEALFIGLGFRYIKWLRHRSTFRWHDIDVLLDNTKGYAYIIELEKMSNEKEKDATLYYLKSKLSELGLKPTPRELFDRHYNYYKQNWKKLIL